LREQGHEVRLVPALYVYLYVMMNKIYCIDAEAIGEAVQRPGMRFVPINPKACRKLEGKKVSHIEQFCFGQLNSMCA
jgi:transposase